ncbi:hypothetical protein [uncultured Aquimarina sp.]|uniref:hypothetical protein n=1 Tax=uncultured Aquimarina sp. TaxID=575652 RepID=UPI002607F8AC|nr:hypothetical protein [uncultured Aquimarina sp.]
MYSSIKLFYKITTILLFSVFFNPVVSQTSDSVEEMKNYLQTKDGNKIELHPLLGVTSFTRFVHVTEPNKNGKQGRYLKIKKIDVEKIILRNEVHVPLDPNAKRPYIFRIVAKNDNYTLGITDRIKKSKNSVFTREYFGIYDNQGNEIHFSKLNRNKLKSIEIIKMYFGDCLDEQLPSSKEEIKKSNGLLYGANQISCD